MDSSSRSRAHPTPSRPTSTRPKQNVPLPPPAHQRAKFFELDYLFAEPRIDWFLRAARRRRRHERTRNDSRTIQMSSAEGSPLPSRSRTRTLDMKDGQKKGERTLPVAGEALHIGDRGEAIHCMRWDSRIRTISSLNENRMSEAAGRQEARCRAKERLVEAQRSCHRLVGQDLPLFAVSAQGVNYSERVTTEQRKEQKSAQKLRRGKFSIAARGKFLKEEGGEKGSEVGVKEKGEGRGCRPWSPVHQSGLHVGLDELLTLQ